MALQGSTNRVVALGAKDQTRVSFNQDKSTRWLKINCSWASLCPLKQFKIHSSRTNLRLLVEDTKDLLLQPILVMLACTPAVAHLCILPSLGLPRAFLFLLAIQAVPSRPRCRNPRNIPPSSTLPNLMKNHPNPVARRKKKIDL